ncbi:MAG: prepilin-type N-terminal cleavage/methylation domain-containing protein [Candidatus Omnitrophica bacterium]|nr:prepilin-type N-terminal cleavage/methylation domain-containing protein [Candidatus Omnitrophota bacterium]
MKKGFTLLELIVVIIVIGVLATLGFSQYTKVVERGRAAEAKTILSQLRSAEAVYYQEYEAYTADFANLVVSGMPGACAATHYFSYACAATGTCTATRCTAGGKSPNFSGAAYTIALAIDGTMTNAGMY